MVNGSRFLWGTFWLLLGASWLANQLGYIGSGFWGRIILFWPLIIVLIGLRLVLRDIRIYTVVGLVLLLGLFGYAVFSPRDVLDYLGTKESVSTQTASLTRDDNVKTLELDIESGAAEIQLSELTESESQTQLVAVDAVGMEKLKTEKVVSGGIAKVVIGENFEGRVVFGTSKRTMNVKVARGVPVKLTLSSGATKSSLDLTELNVTDLSLKSGAATSSVRIGGKAKLVNISVEAGASDYTLEIPKDSGYKVVTKSGLTSVSLPTGTASIVGDDTKTSTNYENSPHRVSVLVSSGLTSLKLTTY